MNKNPTSGCSALNKTPTPAMLAARIKPGQTLNPGGRPKGLEKRVRELVDFDAITLALQDIALGRLPPGLTSESSIRIRDRVDASRLLYDRGFGKARVLVDVAHDVVNHGMAALDVEALDDAAVEIVERAIENALAQRALPLDTTTADVIDASSEEVVPAEPVDK